MKSFGTRLTPMDFFNSKRRDGEPDHIGGDRREDRRYPIELELKYKLIRRKRVLETGVGKTLNLSSGGIYFEAEHKLPVGLNVELLITWPVLLHSVAPMRLLVSGRIVRAEGRRVALRSVQHEFRTQGSPSLTNEPDHRPGNGRGGVPNQTPPALFNAAPVRGVFGKMR
jgi:hypothetical protein